MKGGESSGRISLLPCWSLPSALYPCSRVTTQWAQYQIACLTEGLCVDMVPSLGQGCCEHTQGPVLMGDDASGDSRDKKVWFEAWLCH